MEAVVGVVRERSQAEVIVEALRQVEIADRRISVLSPPASEATLRSVPTSETEPPGVGKALGSVVGGAAGAAGGLAAAAVTLPGIGPVVAAGAIALGVLGAVAGGAVGGQLDTTLSHGLPMDELYVYRDALRKGRSIVVVTVEDGAQAAQVRQIFGTLGAEAVDAARDEWWIGLRDAEAAQYIAAGGDFRKDEVAYRMGFEAACRHATPNDGPFDAVRPTLSRQYGRAVDDPAFRAGYERGRAHRLAASESSRAA